ncbi:MAG TPA: POTRA domain-containing protein, partial [Kofleriaceae bacterium]|nr:POTRA domain-containing protein [Kofleriaceae bacterium]
MLRIAVVLAVVCAACGGAQRPAGRGENAEYLAEIRIEGNRGIETADLVDGLTLHRAQQGGRPPDPFELAQDVERIRGAYQRLGYFSVDVKARIDHKGPASTAVFTITEGRRAAIHLEIRGMTLGPFYDRLRAEMTLKEGAPFDYDVYDDTKDSVEKFLQNSGYAYATVEGDVYADKEHALADVDLVIHSGEPCTFGNITISGAHGDLTDAVKARIAFKPGDRYSVDAINDTHKAISELGRFSTIRIQPDLESNATVLAVKVSLSEGDRHEVRFGGGIGLDPLTWQIRGRAGYSIAGPRTDTFESPLTTIAFDFQPAFAFLRESDGYTPDFSQYDPRFRATLDIRRADLFRTYMTGDLEVGLLYTTVEAFTSYG